MSGAKAKRKGQCSKPGCKARAEKAGKCMGHYLSDYRSGVRVREAEDLGPNPERRTVRLSQSVVKRLDAAVPKGGQGVWLREAVAEKLNRMAGEVKP